LWTLRALPMMLVLVLAPDDRETAQLSLGRITYRTAFVLLCALSVLQADVRVWTVPALALLLVLLATFRSLNVIGDVQMATVADEQLGRIEARINAVVDQALSMAGRVVVVGHSQGGYLSHRALHSRQRAEGSTDRVELIGVGSGLKPIWLLHEFSDRRSLGLAAGALLGGVLVFWAVAPIPLGLFQYLRPFVSGWLPDAVRSLVEAQDLSTVDPVPFDRHLLLPWAVDNPWAPVPDLGQLAALAAGLVVLFLVRRQAGPRIARLQHDVLRRPAVVTGWTEITSLVDSVGRLAVPRLSGADVYTTPGVSNTLLDHISYFRRSSPSAWYLATTLFGPILRDVTPALRQWADHLDFGVGRARTYAAILGLLVLGDYALNQVDSRARGTAALIAQFDHPTGLLSALIAVSLVGPLLALVDLARLSRAMADFPLEPPAPLREARFAPRFLVFTGWSMVAVTAATAGRFPVPYPDMTATETWLMSAAPTAVAVLLLALAAALLAGYRPPLLIWLLVLAAAGYWTTYLPGRGGALLEFLVILSVLAAAQTFVLLRVATVPVEWNGFDWPRAVPAPGRRTAEPVPAERN
jgi:hypothetical protein